MSDKFPEELRTFETRAKFLIEIFDNCFSQKEILAHCIMHKLDRSILLSNIELEQTIREIEKHKNTAILNRINKG